MANEGFQKGTIVVQGKGKTAKYNVRFRLYAQDGTFKRKSVELGLVSNLGKREVSRLAQETIITFTAQVKSSSPLPSVRAETTFRSFYEDIFLPIKKKRWSEEYASSFTSTADNQILPIIGNKPLVNLDKRTLQQLLDNMDPAYSESYIGHTRTCLKTILNEAVELDYLIKSPCQRLELPRGATQPSRHTIPFSDLVKILAKIEHKRDKAILMTGVFCAVRSSELFGIPWKNFVEDEEGHHYFFINQIHSKGKVKLNVKTKTSERYVPISDILLPFILDWRKECKDTSDDALIFCRLRANRKDQKGTGVWAGQWLKDNLHKVTKALNMTESLTFQVLRRTGVSILKSKLNANTTDLAGFLGHKPGSKVTEGVYIQQDFEKQRMVVNGLSQIWNDAETSVAQEASQTRGMRRVK